jgi:hypothetical protein
VKRKWFDSVGGKYFQVFLKLFVSQGITKVFIPVIVVDTKVLRLILTECYIGPFIYPSLSSD